MIFAYDEKVQTQVKNPEPRLLCPECDYDLSGSSSDRCAWCGWNIEITDLVAANVGRHTATRISIAGAALTVSLGTVLALVSLITRGRGLDWHDALAVMSVFIAALGHAVLAYMVLRTPHPWPMRAGEVSNTLRVIGWGSVVASFVAATPRLDDAPNPLVVKGVQVNGIMEFAMTAVFFSLPGVMLLVLRLVSYRHKGQISWFSKWQPEDRSIPPFIIEVAGRHAANQLTQTWSSEPRPTSPTVEEMIARAWEAEVAMSQEDRRELYNGKVGRLIQVEPSDDRLHFVLGETCFRDFLGTNLFHAREIARISPVYLADALGISALVIARDGFLVLGRRSRKVLFHADHLHTFGGLLEAADRTAPGYDLVKSAQRELEEELGVRAEDIASIVVTGLVRDRAILQPELIFDIAVRLTQSELLARFATGHDDEHTALEFLADKPDAAVSFLRHASKITPVAQAAILLHGKHHWGQAWFDRACLHLYGSSASKEAGREKAALHPYK